MFSRENRLENLILRAFEGRSTSLERQQRWNDLFLQLKVGPPSPFSKKIKLAVLIFNVSTKHDPRKINIAIEFRLIADDTQLSSNSFLMCWNTVHFLSYFVVS